MYFWQIKIFIGGKNDSVGCIYDSTTFLNAGENNTSTVNLLVS